MTLSQVMRSATDIARREFYTLFSTSYARAAGLPIAYITADDSATYPVTSAESPLSVIDFAQASGVVTGRYAQLSITGQIGAIGGGSAVGILITLQSPDGVDVASRRVPFSDVSGFTALFVLPDVAVTKYWVKAQLVGVSASPTVNISSLRFGYLQMPSISGSGSFSI